MPAASIGITGMTACLAVTQAWVAAYIICLIIGGGLLVISTVFGHHGDADVDAGDVGIDVGEHGIELGDHDVEVSAGDIEHGAGLGHAGEHVSGLSLSSWFSVRFVVYTMAVFGGVGTVLTFTSNWSPTVVAVLALISGLVAGQFVHQSFRYLRRTSGDSTISAREYMNRPARVTVRIVPPSKGEVVVTIRGHAHYVPAVAKREGDRFNRREKVHIIGFSNGTAEVISQKEHEFMKDEKADS